VKEKDPQQRELFDTNQISVGTEFMYGLREYIKSYYKGRAVMLLDDLIGEGEHKIIRYLTSKEKKKICIYSPDADLIMLGIALDKKNVFIFRPNIYSDIDCAYFLVSIDKFKKDITGILPSVDQNPTQIVNDFVFLLFFLGNDFLPHSPSYEIKYGGINMILSMYQKVLTGSQGLVSVSDGEYTVDVKLLREVMRELAGKEIEMIRLKYKNFRGFPNKLLDKYIYGIEDRFDNYRDEY
jgi:5'-3' exonuclease